MPRKTGTTNQRPPPNKRSAIYLVLEHPPVAQISLCMGGGEVGPDENTIIENILIGRYARPVRVLASNTAQGWKRDVTRHIACAVVVRAQLTGRRLNECRRVCASRTRRCEIAVQLQKLRSDCSPQRLHSKVRISFFGSGSNERRTRYANP